MTQAKPIKVFFWKFGSLEVISARKWLGIGPSVAGAKAAVTELLFLRSLGVPDSCLSGGCGVQCFFHNADYLG